MICMVMQGTMDLSAMVLIYFVQNNFVSTKRVIVYNSYYNFFNDLDFMFQTHRSRALEICNVCNGSEIETHSISCSDNGG